MRWDDVIDGGDGAVGIQHRQLELAQHLERLRTRHLMDQVQADEELRLPARQLGDRVRIPHFVEQCLRHRGPPESNGL